LDDRRRGSRHPVQARNEVVTPLLGADPINHAYHFLVGNRAVPPAAVWSILMAGFGEETVFRGYLFERASKLLGHRAPARAATVPFTSALFGAALDAGQRVAGVEHLDYGFGFRYDLRQYPPHFFPDMRTRGVRPYRVGDPLPGS
jgi:hypothetical protein